MAKMKIKDIHYVTWDEIYYIIIFIDSIISTIFLTYILDFVFMEFFKVLILLICVSIGLVAGYEFLRGD